MSVSVVWTSPLSSGNCVAFVASGRTVTLKRNTADVSVRFNVAGKLSKAGGFAAVTMKAVTLFLCQPGRVWWELNGRFLVYFV